MSMSKLDGVKKYITNYKKGEVIYSKDDSQENFYILNKGKINLKLGEEDVILVSLEKGDFFGEESLNENQNAVYTAEAVEASDVIKIPYPSLKDMMQKNTDIALKILKKQSEKNLKVVANLMKINRAMQEVVPKKGTEEKAAQDDVTSEKVDPNVQAYLIIQRSNRIVQLTKTQTFLGRRDYTTGFIPDVDLTKEDEEKYISRKHARIEYKNEKFYVLEEAGAVNGTFLNGVKLATDVEHELKNEDEITLCHLNIVFKI